MKSKAYRAMVIFDKQVEFFDKLMPVLHEVNCYVTTLDVWSGEVGKDARKEFKKAVKKNACIMTLEELLNQYYAYVPAALSSEINHLHFECMRLDNSQLQEAAAACIDLLFALQNNIRKYMHSAN